MAIEIAVQMLPQGLLIPRAALGDWSAETLEAVREQQAIVIRPRVLTPQRERERAVQALREDGLLAESSGEPLQYPVSPEERAELARKLSIGRPLSHVGMEERAAGW